MLQEIRNGKDYCVPQTLLSHMFVSYHNIQKCDFPAKNCI